MSIERKQIGPRMSMAVVHGNTVYVAGQVAKATLGQGVKAQTTEILAAIDALLAECGTSKQNILSANIWLTDMRTFPEMNEIWDAWVVPGHTPARATVEARLAGPLYLVEIAVIAAK